MGRPRRPDLALPHRLTPPLPRLFVDRLSPATCPLIVAGDAANLTTASVIVGRPSTRWWYQRRCHSAWALEALSAPNRREAASTLFSHALTLTRESHWSDEAFGHDDVARPSGRLGGGAAAGFG